MTKYVLDASVVVAALLKESEEARAIMKRKAEFFAPVILTTEVANVLRFKLPVASEAQSLYQDFSVLPINFLTLNNEQIEAVIKLAYDCNTAIYDAYYHYLALSLEAVFLTLDREYFLKAQKLGSIELIS